MRIRPDFILKNDKDKYIVFATGENVRSFSSSIILQKTAVFMWNLLSERESTKEELANALVENFSMPYGLASNKVDSFLKTLKENGILE